MSTNLMRIGEKACKDPNLVFTTLYHHVTDVDNLSRRGGTTMPFRPTRLGGWMV